MHFPLWPSVLHSTDLSEYVKEQPQEKLWWELPGSPMDMYVEDSGDGLHRSGRINKGKAPAPSDVEPVPALHVMLTRQRGKKRSVVESTGDSDKTVRCAVAPPSRRVVVKSPPEAHHPKQRIRIGEDGQATEPVLSKEQDTGAPEGVWVGRGEGTDTADTGMATRHRRVPKKQPSPQAVANQDAR
ncbi:hypothetical protein BJY52DRAFT_1192781 [Lactarius psammicola]|nr:hypothetical protein BJY52DRAFT_1192781 [Lactarius psammicola]